MTEQIEQGIGAVVFVNKPEIKTVLKTELAAQGIPEETIVFAVDTDDCISSLFYQQDSVVIIDWDMGAQNVLGVFDALVEQQQQYTTSSLLISCELDNNLIFTGAELGVTRVHIGPITTDNIREELQETINYAKNITPVRQELIKVSLARQKGDWHKAQEILGVMYKKDPTNARVLVEVAENYIYLNRWDEARNILSNIENATPPDIRGLHMLGKCLLKLGRSEEACATLQKAKILNPYNIDRLVTLGDILLTLDKPKEAKEDYQEALYLDPENPEATKGKATCMLVAGEVNEALSLFKNTGTGSKKELLSSLNTAAIVAIRLKEIDHGMTLYDNAIKIAENDKYALSRLMYNKGLAYYKTNRLSEARLHFVKAIELDPKYTNAKHNINAIDTNKENSSSTPDSI